MKEAVYHARTVGFGSVLFACQNCQALAFFPEHTFCLWKMLFIIKLPFSNNVFHCPSGIA